MGNKKWITTCDNRKGTVDNLMRKFAFPRPIAMFFASRNIGENEIDSFLEPKLSNLTDPYRFPGIVEASERIWSAIKNREPILIHGDYDTDGITATALLGNILKKNGAEIHSFIPHRFEDGYGFTPESLAKALENTGAKCKVLITVDCGISSFDAVAEARKRGIDVIITDHHEPTQELPDALAIINSKLHDELSDLHLLSGAGVAFKLCHAFIKYGRQHNLGGFSTRLEEVLDFVALGTVADIVPLLGENRIMVKFGIQILKKQFRPGVRTLFESSRIKSALKPSDITFKLAPRINAAGRVGDANTALHLLQSNNIVEAYRYAERLEEYNSIRQTKEQEIFQEAKEQIERKINIENRYSLLVAGKEWHQGVIGIVASRLAREYNRPTIVLTIQNGEAYGSGRSIGDLNLVKVLEKSSNLLHRYGGHPMAVGVGLDSANIERFAEALEYEVRNHFSIEDLIESTSYDGTVEFNEMEPKFFELLEKLSPFGHSNQKPVFRFNDVSVFKCYPVGNGHSRGQLIDRHNTTIDFIAFNRTPDEMQYDAFDILATPQINEYYNERKPQLQIHDIRYMY